MGLLRHIVYLIMCASLLACSVAPNQQQQDDALSSTQEISKIGSYPTLVQNKQQSTLFQYHKMANLDSPIKGIYISQPTLEDRQHLQYLITKSQAAGINTFIIDLHNVTKSYEKNILLVQNSGIRHVARIVVFPFGSDRANVKSEAYWLSRYRLVDAAIKLGAEEIQLDYIRYDASNAPSDQNALDIHSVIAWFKDKINNRAKLQIDVLGEASIDESSSIGQNIPTFAPSIDAVCPMLYPSHFAPLAEQAKHPYDVIYAALLSIKANYKGRTPFKLYPYIELSNYRHQFSEEQLVGYIHGQIAAVEDAKADGWYAWSAGNQYDRLFNILAKNS